MPTQVTTEAVRFVGLAMAVPFYLDVAKLLRVDASKGLLVFNSGSGAQPITGDSADEPPKPVVLQNDPSSNHVRAPQPLFGVPRCTACMAYT